MAAKPTMPKALGNNISTTISAGITDSATSITVADSTGMNASGGYAVLDPTDDAKKEIIYVESVSGSTLTLSSDGRGLGGTTAVTHDSGATITDILVDEQINGIHSQIAIEQARLDVVEGYPFVLVTGEGTQSISTATFTQVEWDDEVEDLSGFHDNSTNKTRLTVPSGQGGLYSVFGQIFWASGSSGDRITRLRKNGAANLQIYTRLPATATFDSHSVSTMLRLAAGDYLELTAYQNHGSPIDITLSSSFFGMARIN